MNRKIVALLLAVMLVASSVAAFAAVNSSTQYVISDDGIWAIVDGNVVKLNVDNVIAESEAEIAAAGLTIVKEWIVDGYKTYLCTDANGDYTLYTVTAEHNKGNNMGEDVSGLPTSSTDSFKHYYTNYGTRALVNSVSFAPKAFGNGKDFQHTAKQLFTVDVKWDCTALIRIKDAEGRLYPVDGASWNAAANAYALNLVKGVNTISWFGQDGAGYHVNGTAKDAKTIQLDVNMDIKTVETFLDGNSELKDSIDIRFDYIVRHGAAHHVAADAAASAPKTGDAGMAYMTLVALIVMMGAAVVVTRKVRNF